MKILKCTVNGKPVQVGYDPRESLLDTLRRICPGKVPAHGD